MENRQVPRRGDLRADARFSQARHPCRRPLPRVPDSRRGRPPPEHGAPCRETWAPPCHDAAGRSPWVARVRTHGPAVGSTRLGQRCFHGRRLERGEPSTHLFTAGERRALRRLKRAAPDAASVWGSERTGPLTDASVRTMIAQPGDITALGVPVHAHQLRYGCGSPLANTQQDTRVIPVDLGHTTIQQTVQDTELAAERLQDLWRD